MGRLAALCAAVLGACVIGSPAGAVMRGMSTEELTDEAATVVVGEVTAMASRWDSRGRIVTDVEIRVAHVWKGFAGQFVIVTHDGGVVGDLGLKTSDSPTFQVGETVVCFLRATDPEGTQRLVGRAQGKYRLDADGWVRKEGFTAGPGAAQVEWATPYQELRERVLDRAGLRDPRVP